LINLDKPEGTSSARAVARVKRLLPRGTKIGHAGTLDPFATGVLLLLIGRATKLCESLMDQPKEYQATVKLGATTPTDDPESEETPFGPASFSLAHGPGHISDSVTRFEFENVLPRFVGAIQQIPPAFSAMKLGGQRAYKLARRGQAMKLEARTVHVYAIELIDFTWPLLKLRIDCGRGTYIRALARDIGVALGVGGYLTELRRTRIGAHTIERSVTLERLAADGVAAHLQAL
jgi:tRNA pseudouridine55 synthase